MECRIGPGKLESPHAIPPEDGQPFTALNGGPLFEFNEAVSLQIYVDDPQELDYFWKKLTAGGDPAAQVCGW